MVTYSIPPIENVSKYAWTIPDLFDKHGTLFTTEPFIDLKVQKVGTGALVVRGESDCHVNGKPASIPVTTYGPLEEPLLDIRACDSEILVSGADNFSWYFNGAPAPQFSGKNLMLSDSGQYYVEVENFCGVKKSNVIQAYPVLMSGVLIPNIITPNGDGKNDFLVIDRSLRNSSV